MLLFRPPTGIGSLLQRLDPSVVGVADPMGTPDPRGLPFATQIPPATILATGGPAALSGAPDAVAPLLPQIPPAPPSLLTMRSDVASPTMASTVVPTTDRPDLVKPSWVDRFASWSARMNGRPDAPTAEQIVENRQLRSQQIADLERSRLQNAQFMTALGRINPDAPDYLQQVYTLATAFGRTEADKLPQAIKDMRGPEPIKLGKDEKLVGAAGNTLATGFRSSDWHYQAADRSAPARFVNPATGEVVNVPGDTNIPAGSKLLEVEGKDGKLWNAAWNEDTGKVTMLAPKPDPVRQAGQQQYLKQAQAFSDLKDAIVLYRKQLKNAGVELMSGEKKALLTNAYANLKLQAKEAANLGALTGPDMGILEQLMQDPTSVLGAATGNLLGTRAENLQKQLTQYEDIVKKRETNLSSVYGRSPSGPNLKEY